MTLEDHEETRRHFDVVAEGIRSEMRFLADGLAVTNEKLERLSNDTDRRFAETRADMAAGFKVVRGEIQAVRTEMAGEFQAVRAEMAEGFKAVRAEMAGEFQAVRAEAKTFRAETARNFTDVRTQMGSTYSDLDRRLRAVDHR
jgi:hypothetical protein